MVNHTRTPKTIFLRNFLRGGFSLTFLFLLIEYFDELNYAIGNAALPAMRKYLGLTYAQVGLMLGLPHVINSFIEPVLMLLGDTRWRKELVTAGGLAIVVSLGMIASAHSFPLMLLGMIIGFPASGAFVTLSQATLMDLNPGREAQIMARWTVAGSIVHTQASSTTYEARSSYPHKVISILFTVSVIEQRPAFYPSMNHTP